MSKTKRYYWIKLRESFLTSDAVDFLMSQKNGAQYVVLYQMLCLKTANTDGKLARQIGDVLLKYDAEKIQRDTKHFDIDTIRVALELYQKLGLVYVGDDNILQISNFDKMIGAETNWAKYKQKQRLENEKKKLENVQQLSNKRLDIRDKDIKSKDIRDKDKDKDIYNNNKEKNISVDVSKNETSRLFLELPKIGGKHNVYEKDIKKYKELYPAIDVKQEIRSMLGWLESNPANKKKNVKAFITRWLSKKQDKAPRVESVEIIKEEPKIKKEKVAEKTEKEKKEMSDKRKEYQKMLEEEEF